MLIVAFLKICHSYWIEFACEFVFALYTNVCGVEAVWIHIEAKPSTTLIDSFNRAESEVRIIRAHQSWKLMWMDGMFVIYICVRVCVYLCMFMYLCVDSGANNDCSFSLQSNWILLHLISKYFSSSSWLLFIIELVSCDLEYPFYFSCHHTHIELYIRMSIGIHRIPNIITFRIFV